MQHSPSVGEHPSPTPSDRRPPAPRRTPGRGLRSAAASGPTARHAGTFRVLPSNCILVYLIVLVSDSPARRGASGSCCGSAWSDQTPRCFPVSTNGHAASPPKEGRRRAATRPAPPLALRQGLAGARWEVRATMRCTNLRHTAVGQVRLRESSRPALHRAVDATRGQLATHPRRREAAGRSVDRAPCQFLRSADGWWETVHLNRTRSKRPSSMPPGPRCRRGLGSAQLHTHTVAIQTFHTLLPCNGA